MSDTATTTFREAYGVLKANAERLRNQGEPNIDDLLEIVTQSVDAYKVCQARIEAVEQALARTLAEATETRDAASTTEQDHRDTDEDEDDVPF